MPDKSIRWHFPTAYLSRLPSCDLEVWWSEIKPLQPFLISCCENHLRPHISPFQCTNAADTSPCTQNTTSSFLVSFDGNHQIDCRELRNHIKHLEKRMIRSMQRDLYGSRDLHPIDYYLDASIITNGLSRAFSTGGWSHHLNTERIPGVVANLRRTNPLQMLSDLRKTRQQVKYAGKVGDARFL